ncbi:MAG: DUF3365 domain-containing protein [Bacteroidota bacterium]
MKKIIFIFVLATLIISCSESLSKKEVDSYTNQGNEIAQATMKKMGGTMVEKMKEGGVKEAVPFCNTKAIPLTNEMSEKFGVTIKRTSHRIRNEENRPNDEEQAILDKYIKLISEGKELNPVVELDNMGNPHYYAPIKIQKKCLTCHGEIGINVTKKSDSIINSYYPKDLATGFKEGDLRGIWSITFNKK